MDDDKSKALTFFKNANLLLEKVFPSEGHPYRESINKKISECQQPKKL